MVTHRAPALVNPELVGRPVREEVGMVEGISSNPLVIPLRKIDLSPFDNFSKTQRRSGSEDERISPDKVYLANIHNHYQLGTFRRVWFGWTFNWFWSAVAGIQLNSIEELYETDLPGWEDKSILGYEVETDSGKRVRL